MIHQLLTFHKNMFLNVNEKQLEDDAALLSISTSSLCLHAFLICAYLTQQSKTKIGATTSATWLGRVGWRGWRVRTAPAAATVSSVPVLRM